MRPAVIVLLATLAVPALAQRAPDEETRSTTPPAVRFEAKPETMDGFPMMVCPRRDAQPEQQSDQSADNQPTRTERPDGCRMVPPKRERHPDYGKGKFYDLTPA